MIIGKPDLRPVIMAIRIIGRKRQETVELGSAGGI